MKYSIYFHILLLAFISSGCMTNSTSEKTQSNTEYNQKLSLMVDDFLRKCSAKSAPVESLYNQDTISFKVARDGLAKEGIAYRSRSAISKDWAYCIEGLVKQTQFPSPPENKEYVYYGDVNWDVVVRENPQLLTPKVKVKQTMCEHQSSFESCYLSYLNRGGQEKGRVDLQFDVFSDGAAKNIQVRSSNFKDKVFLNCIDEAITQIRFPRTENKSILVISFPLVFER